MVRAYRGCHRFISRAGACRRLHAYGLLLGVFACDEEAGFEPHDPDEAPLLSGVIHSGTSRPTLEARPCRPDLFFLERTLWSDPAPDGFAADLANAIDQQLEPEWFCEPADAACVADAASYKTQVNALLPERAGYGRDDGHQRFFRLSFVDDSAATRRTPRRVPVQDVAVCAVLEQIRQTAVTVSETDDDWRIGRECEAIGSGLHSLATDDAKRWHLDRVGASADPAFGAGVRIALVDSGVIPEAVSTLDVVEAYNGVPDVHGVGEHAELASRHVHGTAMAAYLRDLAADASISDYRILNGGGIATVGGLARGIDAALADATDIESLIINLSVGIAPEFSNPNWLRLSDQSCETIEDGVGESVRYVLNVARRLDLAAAPRVTVISAGGNRPLGGQAAAAFDPAPPPPASPCGPAGAGSAPASFLPGLYGELATCESPADAPRVLTLVVGAVDAHDDPSVVSERTSEPVLVAPGENVYADHPGLPQANPGINCVTEVGPERGLSFPLPLTGTSVAAAMTSGAAAMAQGLRLSDGRTPLSAGHLARLVYLTGESTCREHDGRAVRRLSVSGLRTALRQCPSLVRCAESATLSYQDVDENTLGLCEVELVACGLETYATDGDGLDTLCSEFDSVRAYPDSLVTCIKDSLDASDCLTFEDGCVSRCGPDDIAAGLCSPSPPPTGSASLDRFVLGGTGPQPESSSCLDCAAVHQAEMLTLVLNLNPILPPETDFEHPEVAVLGLDGQPVMSIPLYALTDTSTWQPGAVVLVPEIDISAHCTASTCADVAEELEDQYRLQLNVDLAVGDQHGWDSTRLTVY